MGRLFTYISDPLTVIFPGRDPQEQALFTRALFSSIHGIILLGLDQASSGVPTKDIDRMIAMVLKQLVASNP